jgi:hypothetical protein
MADYTALAAKPSTDSGTNSNTNGNAVVNIAAPSSAQASIYITGVTFSWGAAPTVPASATIKEDTGGANAVRYQFEVPQAASLPWAENWGIRPLKIAAGKDCSVALPALGTGVKGTVTVRYFTA